MTSYQPSGGLPARLARLAGDLIAARGARRGRLCIVNYHRILETADPLLGAEPDMATFRWQMKLLADCFNVMPLHEALTALNEHRIPPRAVCITFDDGYRSTHDLALPVLREFNLAATVFVTSGYVGEGSMWNDRILESVRKIDSTSLDLREDGHGIFPIGSLNERKEAVLALTEKAKYLPPPKRQALIDRLDQMAGIYQPDPMLTEEMIRTLSAHQVEIGAHTVSHPILTSLVDAKARQEITESKHQLERIIGKPVRYFAYPNGKKGVDFDERHVAMAQDAGFSAAFTTAIGAATAADNQFTIPRSRPWDGTRMFFGLRLLRWLAR
jgi:peptidoglycan/xylan/chitin deacetylase (PgdA/CDA1 family)